MNTKYIINNAQKISMPIYIHYKTLKLSVSGKYFPVL